MDDKKNEDYAIRMPEFEMKDLSRRASPSSSRDSFLSQKSSNNGKTASILPANITNNGPISILAYCIGSISMTVTNKYVVSGTNWNLNFFYLAIQVCCTKNLQRLKGQDVDIA